MIQVMQQRHTYLATNTTVKKSILKHKKPVLASKSFFKSNATNFVNNTNAGKSEIDAIFNNIERLKVSKKATFSKGKPLDNSHFQTVKQLSKGSSQTQAPTFHHFKNPETSETAKKSEVKDLNQHSPVKSSPNTDNKSFQSVGDSLPAINNSSLVSSTNMIVEKKKQLWEKEKEEREQMGDYNPWGKGGCGAPMKDQYQYATYTEYSKAPSNNNLPDIHTSAINSMGSGYLSGEKNEPQMTNTYLQQQQNQNNHHQQQLYHPSPQHQLQQLPYHDFGNTTQNVSRQGIITNFNYDSKQLTPTMRLQDNISNNLYGRKRGEHKIISGAAMKSFIYGTNGSIEEVKRKEKEEERRKDMEYREYLRIQIEEKKRHKQEELEKEKRQDEEERQKFLLEQQQLQLEQQRYAEHQHFLQQQQFIQQQQQFAQQQQEQEHSTPRQLQHKQHFKQKHQQQQFLQQQQHFVGTQQFAWKNPSRQGRRVSIVTDDDKQLDEKFNQENLERARTEAVRLKDLNKIKTMAQNGHDVSKWKVEYEAKYGPIDIHIPSNKTEERQIAYRPIQPQNSPILNRNPPTSHQIREEHPPNIQTFDEKLYEDDPHSAGDFVRASYRVTGVDMSTDFNNVNKRGILKNNTNKYSNKNIDNVEYGGNSVSKKIIKENVNEYKNDINNKRCLTSGDNYNNDYVNDNRSYSKTSSTNRETSRVMRSPNKEQEMKSIDKSQASERPSKQVRHNTINDNQDKSRNINTSESYNQQQRQQQQQQYIQKQNQEKQQQQQYIQKQNQERQQQQYKQKQNQESQQNSQQHNKSFHQPQQNQQKHMPLQSLRSPDTHSNVRYSTTATTNQQPDIKGILNRVKDNLLERATIVARLDKYTKEATKPPPQQQQQQHHHQHQNPQQHDHQQQYHFQQQNHQLNQQQHDHQQQQYHYQQNQQQQNHQQNQQQQNHQQQHNQLHQLQQKEKLEQQQQPQHRANIDRLKIHGDDNDYEAGDEDDDDDDCLEEYVKPTDGPTKSSEVLESIHSVERKGDDDDDDGGGGDDDGQQQVDEAPPTPSENQLEKSFLRLKQGLSAKQMKWSMKL